MVANRLNRPPQFMHVTVMAGRRPMTVMYLPHRMNQIETIPEPGTC